MKESNQQKFLTLADDEVLSFEGGWEGVNKDLGVNSWFKYPVLTIGQFTDCIDNMINMANLTKKEQLFSEEGIQGKALRFGHKGWQKGKIRVKLTVEFCPDEPEVEEPPSNNQSEMTPPESPLDDLRRQLFHQANSPNNL